MKVLSTFGWLAALRSAWSRARRRDADPAEMGTAFGLDSITVVEFGPGLAPGDPGVARPSPLQRRLDRRSRL